MKISSEELQSYLKQIFGFPQFKGNQEAAIMSLLSNNDTFVIMPTGGGKSLCYQLPALISEGTAIIVSPLIALMKNQVDAIRGYADNPGIAHFLNSSLSKVEIKQVREDILSGITKLLYVAPESLTKEENIEFLKQINISFFAIDEAHCISEWGHDFRPEYRRLRPIINAIGKEVPIIALTATATPKVQKDIQKNLLMMNANFLLSSFNRPNLHYEIRRKNKESNKDIVRFIKNNSGKSGIIYCLSRKNVEEFSEMLVTNGIKALPYHAGLEAVVRAENQDRFIMEDVDVIVATIAFGMGIDKPDVRFVIHYDIPKSLEGYYQETGRAGRDGGEGVCVAYYSEEDIARLEKFLKDKSLAEQEIAQQLIYEIVSYAESATCRRKNILHYFGEKYEEENCGMCDNCLNPKEKINVLDDVTLLIETILEIKELFKTKHIVQILLGNALGSVKTAKHNFIPQFGAGKDKDDLYWNAVVKQAILENLIVKDIENFGILKITEKGYEYLKNPYRLTIVKDHNYKNNDDTFTDAPNGKDGGATDTTLYAMLKNLLKDIAKKEKLPPYVIFQETSLEDMTIHYPITMDELKQISGVGEGKAKKYGQPFIDLIKVYVEENNIDRPQDMVVKSIVKKSEMKVSIIKSTDRQVPLDDIAESKGLKLCDLITEIEHIVASGTSVKIRYYVDEYLDPYHVEEIWDYFLESETDCVQMALKELGENEFTEEEVRLVRIMLLSEKGN